MFANWNVDTQYIVAIDRVLTMHCRSSSMKPTVKPWNRNGSDDESWSVDSLKKWQSIMRSWSKPSN